jgi:hypothetical protein
MGKLAAAVKASHGVIDAELVPTIEGRASGVVHVRVTF